MSTFLTLEAQKSTRFQQAPHPGDHPPWHCVKRDEIRGPDTGRYIHLETRAPRDDRYLQSTLITPFRLEYLPIRSMRLATRRTKNDDCSSRAPLAYPDGGVGVVLEVEK